jgi:hypothetical protein
MLVCVCVGCDVRGASASWLAAANVVRRNENKNCAPGTGAEFGSELKGASAIRQCFLLPANALCELHQLVLVLTRGTQAYTVERASVRASHKRPTIEHQCVFPLGISLLAGIEFAQLESTQQHTRLGVLGLGHQQRVVEQIHGGGLQTTAFHTLHLGDLVYQHARRIHQICVLERVIESVNVFVFVCVLMSVVVFGVYVLMSGYVFVCVLMRERESVCVCVNE